MRFNILSIENKRPKWATDLFDLYVKRFDKSIQISWTALIKIKLKGLLRIDQIFTYKELSF